MASVASDSPVRRFATKQKKENSPVELNRLKSLLKKKVGDDGGGNGSLASPKKTATPRKEMKFKRGTVVKLCSSCANHNKDLHELKNDEMKKKRTVSKKNTENQKQDPNPITDNKNAIKKPTAKKPRETKRKAGAQGETLEMPSISGTASSMTEDAVITDSVHQTEGESKPKSKRKKVNASPQLANSVVEKENKSNIEAKHKDIIKVKVARPRKTKMLTANNEKAQLDNMDPTDSVHSIPQSKETMQSSQFEPHPALNDLLTNEHEPSVHSPESNKKKKNKNSAKSKIPRPVKTSKKNPMERKKALFKDTDVTDLVDSTHQEEAIIEKRDDANTTGDANDNSIGLQSSSMFENNSSVNIQTRKKLIDFCSNLEADKGEGFLMNYTVKTQGDKPTSTKSKTNILIEEDSSINRDMSTHNIRNYEVQNHSDDFNLDISDNPIPLQVITEASTGEKINLSASTNLSRDDVTVGMSMNISNETINNTVHSSIHHDATFLKEHLPNDTFEQINKKIANVTLRSEAAEKNKNNMNADQNINSDGIIFFSYKDSKDTMTDSTFIENDETFCDENQQPSVAGAQHLLPVKLEPVNDGDSSERLPDPQSPILSDLSKIRNLTKKSDKLVTNLVQPKPKSKGSKVLESTSKSPKSSELSKKNESPKKACKEKLATLSSPKTKKKSKEDETLCEKHKSATKYNEQPTRHHEKKRMSKELKNDLKVAKAIEGMSHHFSKISIGTTIGTINSLHISIPSDSDSSSECSTDCSCSYEFSSESSGDHCKCWRCLQEQNDSSDSSSDESSSNECECSSSSLSSSEEIHRPIKKSTTKTKEKKIVKPTYKEKLSRFISKYDMRSNSSKYESRSHDH
ncbi:serine-rich adhesin for platelets-like isoform X2 [Phymastichus coffea]|uniref:serine-rich adhesin for platelets-like isoform X2 n=1 Tax=Phymastichus coffea TaxID=108790 RepID=UPI00273C58CB|nr:serine-rich adhesin for platelets-like isoform X2 [Phymastichus coffea]